MISFIAEILWFDLSCELMLTWQHLHCPKQHLQQHISRSRWWLSAIYPINKPHEKLKVEFQQHSSRPHLFLSICQQLLWAAEHLIRQQDPLTTHCGLIVEENWFYSNVRRLSEPVILTSCCFFCRTAQPSVAWECDAFLVCQIAILKQFVGNSPELEDSVIWVQSFPCMVFSHCPFYQTTRKTAWSFLSQTLGGGSFTRILNT